MLEEKHHSSSSFCYCGEISIIRVRILTRFCEGKISRMGNLADLLTGAL